MTTPLGVMSKILRASLQERAMTTQDLLGDIALPADVQAVKLQFNTFKA